MEPNFDYSNANKMYEEFFVPRNLAQKPFGTPFNIGLVINDCMDMNITTPNKFGAKLLGVFCPYKYYKHYTILNQ